MIYCSVYSYSFRFVFFKQKTAYEMRISDWSSDVCSSDLIAGQGTVALEMLETAPDIDTLVVPIGGGGLISGMAVAAKALKPGIEVVGVQAELYPSMYAKLRGLKLPCEGDTLAEGIAVKTPGDVTFQIIRELVDDEIGRE